MLKIGIVGLPNVGKSTLFNALTKASVPCENYPFCTIDPAVGVVGVPDPRLEALAALSKSKKIIPAAIEFVDIAGLVKGAAEGQGLGNQFLANIRETDAILQVVRFFDDPNILHVDQDVEPYKDIEVINLELVLADSEQVRKRRDKLVRDIKAGLKDAVAEEAALAKLEQGFAAGKLAFHAGLTDDEKKRVQPLNLLTMKPILYALNKKSGGHNLDELADGRAERAYELIKSLGSHYMFFDAATERELNDVADEDRSTFRQELGVPEDGLAALITEAYRTLDLISFFTTGPDETRAWTITRGSAAPVAGAAIHTDFLTKFIRAEVVPAKDLLALGGYAAAREAAKVRTEGKEYIVQDSDVIVFLHG
ncbi:redox-regulated ATPase YchF [Candidatus Kaiserbacteria bacterium RIFCSPLOWO2_12_FULL_52_8]|uniref:Ribosome-binding ATPase YchF n=1 Tax=Candidatus Kaiserbacteria bacterium RIFCSPHIGHO2_01_FULL_53_31 TaxID=1798481 RepID=A0A1F6CHG9_9BACT|nr:MAG: redox-regulated ATPase YchF [Candidatus Kaiserbacteria bacterium RIFCSPHIGHO2_01_FULL_53_31]OGG92856.1 MAG: redox-regulated ATPase YchF [Candidatus Kaiserbacteria bacterium RIFCSPLOWO2_12_FULL_52_8]